MWWRSCYHLACEYDWMYLRVHSNVFDLKICSTFLHSLHLYTWIQSDKMELAYRSLQWLLGNFFLNYEFVFKWFIAVSIFQSSFLHMNLTGLHLEPMSKINREIPYNKYIFLYVSFWCHLHDVILLQYFFLFFFLPVCRTTILR